MILVKENKIMLFPTDILSELVVFEKAGIKSGSSMSVMK